MKTFLNLSVFMCCLLCLAPKSNAAKWRAHRKGSLTTKIGVIQPELQLGVKPESGNAPPHEYHPAPSKWSFLSFDYANFGASLSSKTANTLQEDVKYGSSQATDFQVRFFGKRVSHEYYYQNYKGYYLQNTIDVVPNYDTTTPLLQQPNLTMEAEGMNVLFNFNSDNYNLGAAFNQSARQTESGGAWLAMASLNRIRMTNSDSFVMGTAIGQYPGFEDIRAMNIYTAKFGLGGGYTAVWRDLYASILAVLSAGQQKAYVDTVGQTTEEMNQSNGGLHAKIGLGYNSESFLVGLRYNMDNNNFRIQKTNLSLNTGEFQVHLGWRFHEMGWTWVDDFSAWLFD